MTLVFIAWGDYAGFDDVLKCAVANAGVPVHVISDTPRKHGIFWPVNRFDGSLTGTCIQEFKSLLPPERHANGMYPAIRWLILHQFIIQNRFISKLTFPVFCADWDVMIFRNLEQAYKPFFNYDYTVSVDQGTASAAYCINNESALAAYCDMLQSMVFNRSPAIVKKSNSIHLNDMDLWSRNQRLHEWYVGNLWEMKDGTVFDHNMHSGGETFQMDGPAKRVVWVGNKPAFALHSGQLVRANTIHCWGTYKSRTGEVLMKAGL